MVNGPEESTQAEQGIWLNKEMVNYNSWNEGGIGGRKLLK